ncbi:MAG: hypothetical protein Q7T80_03615 [Methanoregula sp.]|nr:hypothetical protein [Methanoregula sp.]
MAASVIHVLDFIHCTIIIPAREYSFPGSVATRGLAYLMHGGSRKTESVGRLAIERYRDGHRTGYVPERLGEGAVPERAELLRNRKEGHKALQVVIL